METGIDKEQIIKAKYQIKEYIQLIFSVLVLGACFLLFLFFVKPTFAKYQKIKLDIKDELVKEGLLDVKLVELQKAKEIQGSIDDNIKLANQAVPDESDIPTVMAMIQDIASNSAVKVSTFSYIGLSKSELMVPDAPVTTTPENTTAPDGLDAAVDSEYFDAFNLSISVVGKFENLNNFLKKIENSRRILDASGFSYSVEKENEQITSDFYTLKIQLTSYYRSFANVAPRVALDLYKGTITELNSLSFYEVDLSDTRIGKDDPFGNTGSKTSKNNSSTQGTSGSSFFGGSGNSNGTDGNSGSNDPNINVVEPVEDREAAPGDVQKLLQDLLKQEGL